MLTQNPLCQLFKTCSNIICTLRPVNNDRIYCIMGNGWIPHDWHVCIPMLRAM
jgi:hypothetical protein